jgi:hypothetical protein
MRRQCLLVVLRPQLALAKNLQWPLQGFVLDGSSYRDVGFGDWTGFYDWLRDANENVLGVRYWLRDDTEFLVGYAKGLGYVQADQPSHYIEIYFSQRREIVPKLSSDQDFLYDSVFRSDDGVYAIGFGIGGLSELDMRSLQSIEIGWAKAETAIK